MSKRNPQDAPAPAVAPTQWPPSAGQVPSPNVQATMHQMTEQLQTVIDAAERAAEAIRYDAEEQARRHLAEAQRKADRLTAERVGLISELTDDLVRHAANVRDHSEQMVRALEDAIHTVTDKLEQPGMKNSLAESEPAVTSLPFVGAIEHESPAPSGFPVFPYDASRADGQGSVAYETPAVGQPVGPELSQEALQHATRLAIAGEDREMIINALRRWYGINDPEPIVDQVIGRSR